MVDMINKFWQWMGFTASSVVMTNEFGNIIFVTDKEQYWHMAPDQLSCTMVAPSTVIWEMVKEEEAFKNNWDMSTIISVAEEKIGPLNEGEVYCLKLPAVLGGLYDAENIGKISQEALIRFSGEMAYQIKDLPDGEKISFDI